MANESDRLTGVDLRRFRDRHDAGARLAERLRDALEARPAVTIHRDDLIVLALPRGGVPVADEVSRALGAPLDLLIVRKLGVPGQEELAFGAIATGGVRILNHALVRALGLDETQIQAVASREQLELARRESLYRRDQPPLVVKDKTVIIVDDGLATGATMRAAVASIRALAPRRIIVAVPVAAPEICREFRSQDHSTSCECLLTPDDFQAVGEWYDDFSPTTDDEVLQLLALNRNRLPACRSHR